MLGNDSELIDGFYVCDVKGRWGHALQVCQISTRYLNKQIIYGKRNRTNSFKLYQDLG